MKLKNVLKWLATVNQVRKDRQTLLCMEDKLLKDIGLNRCEIYNKVVYPKFGESYE